jgi:hypothetical protein
MHKIREMAYNLLFRVFAVSLMHLSIDERQKALNSILTEFPIPDGYIPKAKIADSRILAFDLERFLTTCFLTFKTYPGIKEELKKHFELLRDMIIDGCRDSEESADDSRKGGEANGQNNQQ